MRKALRNVGNRVLRGGSYYFGTRVLRSTRRYWLGAEDRHGVGGFRLIARKVR
jgi:formylglycine-generating enzyme required for sulfatase activity